MVMHNDYSESTPTVSQRQPFAIIPLAVLYHEDLTPHDVAVYGTLADRANRNGEAWPGHERMASDLGISKRTVIRSIEKLEELGLVEVKRSDGSVNHYHLPWVTSDSQSPPRATESLPTSDSQSPEQEPLFNQTHKPEIALTSAHTQMKEALVDAMGWRREDMSSSMWGQVEKYGKELREMNVDPTEVSRRAQIYRVNRPHQTLSPAALVKWWPDCAEVRLSPERKDVRKAAERAEIQRRLRE